MRILFGSILCLFFHASLRAQSLLQTDSVYRSFNLKLQKKDTAEAQKLLKWLDQNKERSLLQEFYFELAGADNQLAGNETENAFAGYMKALRSAEKLKIDSLLFKANYKIGDLYLNISDLPNALQYFNRSLALINSANKIEDRIFLYKDIALVYSYLDRNQMAIDYFLKMEPLIIKAGNKKFLGNTYNNIAINYVDLKNFTKALFYYRNSLAIRLEINDTHGVAQVNNNLGGLYYDWKQYDLALECFFKGRELREKAGVPVTGLIESDINIGKTYSKLKQTSKAIQFLESGRKEAIKIDHIELERRADEQLYPIYEKLGDYKKAFELQSRYNIIKDSLYSQTKKEEISRLSFESKLQADSVKHREEEQKLLREKEQAKALHNEKEKRSSLIRNISIGGFIFALIIALVLYKQVKKIRLASKTIARQKDQIEAKQKEVMDSIYYARRIQRSQLSSERYIERTMERLKETKVN